MRTRVLILANATRARGAYGIKKESVCWAEQKKQKKNYTTGCSAHGYSGPRVLVCREGATYDYDWTAHCGFDKQYTIEYN